MDYKKFSDVVYYEPMSDNEILDMEKVIGKSIKPLYREYLSAFGMTQDIFDGIGTSCESFMEDFDFIKDSLKDYLPIFSAFLSSSGKLTFTAASWLALLYIKCFRFLLAE